MNVLRLMTRPVAITTPAVGSIGDDGEWNPGAPSTFTVLGYVEQASTQEDTDGQQTASGQWWAALPIGTPVAATSTLTIDDSGQRFEVVGEPATRWNFRLKRNEFVRVELSTVTAGG